MTTTEPMTPADLGRAWRELPGWRWMPGMLALGSKSHRSAWFRVIEPLPRLHGDWSDAIPDTTDHATIGCLHALAEEIVGGPVDLDWEPRPGQWRAYSPSVDKGCVTGTGPTKAHALYALVMEVSRG